MYWSKAKDADLWISICEEMHTCRQTEILNEIEIEHVEAHSAEKERQHMSLFEKVYH